MLMKYDIVGVCHVNSMNIWCTIFIPKKLKEGQDQITSGYETGVLVKKKKKKF